MEGTLFWDVRWFSYWTPHETFVYFPAAFAYRRVQKGVDIEAIPMIYDNFLRMDDRIQKNMFWQVSTMACIGAVGNAKYLLQVVSEDGMRAYGSETKHLESNWDHTCNLIYLIFSLFPALTFASFAPGQDPEGNVTIVGDVDKFGISDHPKLGTAIIQSLVFDGFSHVHLKKQHGIITLWLTNIAIEHGP